MQLGKFFLYKAIGTLIVISIVLVFFLIAKSVPPSSQNPKSSTIEGTINDR